jgi:hypothetical protein
VTPDNGRDSDAVNAACPLQCRLRHGAAGDNPINDRASARDRVDWAGLPIDLDLAFSREKCDKVYAQHLMRKRGAQLWRWLRDGGHLCVCDLAADHGHPYPHAAESTPSR